MEASQSKVSPFLRLPFAGRQDIICLTGHVPDLGPMALTIKYYLDCWTSSFGSL